MATKVIKIEGMQCEGCRGRIQKLLNALPGVEAEVSLENKEAVVNIPDDLQDKVLTDKITGAGFTVLTVS